MFNKEEAQKVAAEDSEHKETRPIIPEIKSLETPFMGSAGALILVATVLVVLGTGILYLFKYSRINLLKSKSTEYSNLHTTLNSGELGKFQKDLSEIVNGQRSLNDVLENRIYWSRFWSQLQKWTPKSVDYSSMTIDESGTVAINGETSSYNSLAKLMVSLQDVPLFTNVQIGGFGQTRVGNRTVTSFNLKMNVNTSLLTKSSELVIGNGALR